MSSLVIVRESKVERTPRVMQIEGIFDVPPSERSTERWVVDVQVPSEWNIGLIVGPSGSGKTTVAKELFHDHIVEQWPWPTQRSILDGFPATMSIKEITDVLSSVGFSSPPLWLRPFSALSNGEQFRVNLARTIAECKDLAVMDEFTSVVDRTVAQIGSYALQKAVRNRKGRFVAISCHYDIIEWLEPDWIFKPSTGEWSLGRRLRRPPINLTIQRVHHSAWKLFSKYHYLTNDLHNASACFVASYQGKPVAFDAWISFFHPIKKNTWREHRVVTLPDYQGVGIGNALSNFVASVMRGLGRTAISTTANPSLIKHRNRSSLWALTRKPSRSTVNKNENKSACNTRRTNALLCGFTYVGPAADPDLSNKVWNE